MNTTIFLHQRLAATPFFHVMTLKNKPLGADAKFTQVAALNCWISSLCLTPEVDCHNVRTQSSSSPCKEVYCLSLFAVSKRGRFSTTLEKDKPIFMCFLNGSISVPNSKCYLYVTSHCQSTQGKKWHIAQFCLLFSRSQGVGLMNKPTMHKSIQPLLSNYGTVHQQVNNNYAIRPSPMLMPALKTRETEALEHLKGTSKWEFTVSCVCLCRWICVVKTACSCAEF